MAESKHDFVDLRQSRVCISTTQWCLFDMMVIAMDDTCLQVDLDELK